MWTKRIHFSFGFFDDVMPDKIKHRIAKVKKANPEFKIKVWGPKESRDLMARRFPWALEKYDFFPYPIQRSDMSRYAILYEEGGLYMDLDYKLRQPLDAIFKWLDTRHPQGQVFINESANQLTKTQLSNSLMIAKAPGHPFWPFLLQEITKVKGAGRGLTRYTKIITSAGPERVTIAFRKYKGKKLPSYETVIPLEGKYFNPCSICARGNACAKGENVLAAHLNAGTWHSFTGRVYKHFYCHRVFYYILVPCVIVVAVIIALIVVRLKRCRKSCKPCQMSSKSTSHE